MKRLFFLSVAAAFLLSGFVKPAYATPGIPGTTLSATKTATGHFTRTFGWTIHKSVAPASWDLFVGDTADSRYTVSVTKDTGSDTITVDGQICLTNGGAVTTEGLQIVDQVQYNTGGGGGFTDLAGATQTITPAQLAAGASACYDYSIPVAPVSGASYRNVAHVTITNHSGWQPGDHNCPGTLPCPFGPDPKVDFSIPSPTLVNDTIHVTDTNGQSWTFSDSGSQNYTKTFDCSDGLGQHSYNNTATIDETGAHDDANVIIRCFDPSVNKTALTTADRTYHWTIDKSADQSSLTLALNEHFTVNYTVTPGETFTDGNWGVHGNIVIHNSSPIPAVINSISDIMTGGILPTLTCPVTFPTTVGPYGTVTCTYSASLLDAATRTNTATIVQQNYSYDSNDVATPNGTTSYSGDAVVDFASADITSHDTCVNLSDSVVGSLGKQCIGDEAGIHAVKYSHDIINSTCGSHTYTNIASFVTNDSSATGSDSWDVVANTPCVTGCTLTIGYWKNHAGLGPQPNVMHQYLDQWLGNASGLLSYDVVTEANAVKILSFKLNSISAASNGISKLYAQLLGAKLNIAAHASPGPIQSVISGADNYLSNHNESAWASELKSQKNSILSWAAQLDAYNNGLWGVPHCSE